MTALNNVIFINISKVCRICLVEGDNMRSVYSNLDQTEVLEVNVCILSEVLTRITNLPVVPNDGFPSLICSNCVSLINGAYKFKVQFDHSHTILQQCISNCIKQEIDEPDMMVDYIGNSNDFDCDSSVADRAGIYPALVADNFIDSITKSQNKQYGRPQTSKQQSQKRQSNTTVEIKQPKKKGRKPKVKTKADDCDDMEEKEESNGDKPLIMHPCPVCTKEFSALELRKHAHTHKALKKYLSIPAGKKVKPTTRFYVEPDHENAVVGLHSRKEKLHNCVSCGLECSASYLRLHLQMHQNQTEYKCDQCQRVFKMLNHLNNHRVKHLKERPFKCEQCGKGFVIKMNYERHVLTHNTNQELPFKNRSDLKAHECVPAEQAVNTRFSCKVCNKVFKNSSGLYNHNRNNHKPKGAKVLCSVCGNYFTNIYNHMRRHSGEKPFQCNQCDKRFIRKSQLRQHLLVHSGLKPFVCSVCAKAFNNLNNLQVHERIHKGDRCHVCTICNKSFVEKTYLKKHMNVHTKLNRNIHKVKGAKVLCSVCGKNVSDIYNHMRRHSGEKPFQCNQCGKRFITNPQLRQHLLVHSGLKPFVCSVCAKAFKSLYNLQVHERIHKGDRCHVCTICNKGFLEKSYLKKHLNVHTKV